MDKIGEKTSSYQVDYNTEYMDKYMDKIIPDRIDRLAKPRPSKGYVSSPIYDGHDILNDSVEEEYKEEEGLMYFFEIHDMFSKEVRKLFEAMSSASSSGRFLHKTNRISDYYDQMLQWDRLPQPLRDNFWDALSKSQRGQGITPESIATVEDSIKNVLNEYGMTIEQYMEANYRGHDDL